MSFSEFLIAMGKEDLEQLVENKDFQMIKLFKTKFEILLKEYCYVGGMPEVVQSFIQNNDFKEVRTIQKRILSSYERDFSKHIPSNTVEKARMLWNNIPSQLVKENKKFIYNAVKKRSRAKEFETALTWLKNNGLVYQIHRIKKTAFPLSAYTDLDAFKLFIVDIGLLGAMVGLEASTILDKYSIFEEFKGALAEQYVLQQLKTIEDLPIFYWTNETNRSEVDFVTQHNSKIIPIEVKSSINLKARSLKIYMDKYKPEIALRTSLSDFKNTEDLFDIPLYAIEHFDVFE